MFLKLITQKLNLFGIILIIIVFAEMGYSDQLFKTEITVNNLAISKYDIIQRKLFYELIGKPGDPTDEAKKDLINEKVQLIALQGENVKLKPDELEKAYSEYSKRLKVDSITLTKILAKKGIDKETILNYLLVEQGWKRLIIKKIVPTVKVSDHEIQRVHMYSSGSRNTSVLLSEISLPGTSNKVNSSNSLIREILKKPRSFNEFSKLASRFSAAKTAENGGKLNWIPLKSLSKEVQSRILILKIGEISHPLRIGQSLMIFQLRDIKIDKVKDDRIDKVKNSEKYKNIRDQIFNQRVQSQANVFLGELKAKTVILFK